MRIAVIGRTEILYDTANLLIKEGYEIVLIVTSKEAPEYTKTSEDFRQLAEKIGAKYIYTNNLDSSINDIRTLNVDIAISVNYSSIISQSVINEFPLGVLNAHGGDLPRYRGNACQAWAIINGENRIGLCVHSMVGGEMDSGNIIQRKYFEIDINTKVTACWQWMCDRVPTMFLDAVKALEQDKDFVLEIQSKDKKDALRCYPRTPEDGKIDWNKSNMEILRLINASNKPYAGAYSIYEEKKMIIWDAELYDDGENYLAVAGQIASLNTDGSVIVITGNGKLKINEIEYDGFVGKPKNKIKSIRKRLK